MPTSSIGGPVRSEAALAAMDLLSKYKKVSILTTGALTPAYQKRIGEEYDKFKYCFRISGEVGLDGGRRIHPLSHGYQSEIWPQ